MRDRATVALTLLKEDGDEVDGEAGVDAIINGDPTDGVEEVKGDGPLAASRNGTT